MKTLFFYFLAATFILSGCKTSENGINSLSQEQLSELATDAIKNHNFVLEAEYIVPRSGASIFVNSNTNFISVQNDKATIQLALSTKYSGPNGIGGITLDGNVSNEKINVDKKGNIFYSINVQGTGLSATVTFTMPKGTNRCTATVVPNFSGNTITFSGNVYPASLSNVYKARSL